MPLMVGPNDQAYREGRDSFLRDPDRLDSHNPYNKGDHCHDEWERGFREAGEIGSTEKLSRGETDVQLMDDG